MGADIRDVDMTGIEYAGCRGHILTVEGHTGMADDKGVDPQVEGFVTGGILRGEGVEHELEIGFRQRIALIEKGVGTEELCR